MGDLSIGVESDLSKVLLGLQQQGQNIDRYKPIIGEMLVGAVQDVFEAEGPGWQDLAESTKRRRRVTSYKILQDTGILATTIAAQYGADYVEAVSGTSYGGYHAPDPQGRDWTVLGPFQQPLLDDVAALLLSKF